MLMLEIYIAMLAASIYGLADVICTMTYVK